VKLDLRFLLLVRGSLHIKKKRCFSVLGYEVEKMAKSVENLTAGNLIFSDRQHFAERQPLRAFLI
jgi:hypothetical protein